MKPKTYVPAGPRNAKVTNSKITGNMDFQTKNPLTLKVPVHYKTVDFYKLIVHIIQNNDNYLREFKKKR